MRIDILIPTHGRPTVLGRTLTSLAEASLPDALNSIMVIENGSAQGAEEVCGAFVDRIPLHYHHLPTPGKSRALQWAVERIAKGLVIFFDDDIRLAAEVVTAYADAAYQYGPGHFFGGPMGVDYEQDPPDWLRQRLPVHAVGWEPQQFEPDSAQGAQFFGCNFAAFAEDILAVGGFNANLGPGSGPRTRRAYVLGQETWIQERLIENDAQPVYLPHAKVWHYVPRERCSPAWLLDWQHRGCMTAAFRGEGASDTVWWGPLPRWLWSGLARSLPMALASYVMPVPEWRYEMRRPWRRYLGIAEGLKLRARRAA